jgi:rhomboid protease GluP
MSAQDMALKYIEARQRFTDEEDFLAPAVFDRMNKEGGFLTLFKPHHGYMATPILVAINIAVFLIMVASGVSVMEPETEAIYNWGGNYGPAVLEGQY